MLVTSRKIGESLTLTHRRHDPKFQSAVVSIFDANHLCVKLAVQICDQWFVVSLARGFTTTLKIGPNSFVIIEYVQPSTAGQYRIGVTAEECIHISRSADRSAAPGTPTSADASPAGRVGAADRSAAEAVTA